MCLNKNHDYKVLEYILFLKNIRKLTLNYYKIFKDFYVNILVQKITLINFFTSKESIVKWKNFKKRMKIKIILDFVTYFV